MEDRLSNLPDVIITQILKYLKTKEAVRTGILSTRWKSVWAFVPILDLCKSDFQFKGEGYSDPKVEARFLAYMDQVLIARKAPSFEKIRILCYNLDPSLIISWIRAALERNVSELHVNSSVHSVDPPCKFTQKLFSCNKLVVLKLRVDMTLYFPKAFSCFPNLKVLELVNILYKDDDSATNVLSSCPVLEDLVIRRYKWDNLRTLNLTSPSLKRLKVYSTTESLDKGVDVRKMVIDTPTVESLDIRCFVQKEYVVKDLSSVAEAKLELGNLFSSSDTHNNYIICLYELLRRISNVKFLTLASYTIDSLSRADFYELPLFDNLTRLEIVGDDRKNFWKWKLVIEILKSSPLLEILIFRGFSFSPEERGKASEWDVPNCLVAHLKTIEIGHYGLDDDGVEKVRYLLINARVLEKMTIRSFRLSQKLKLNDISDATIFKNSKGSVTWSDTEIIISSL